MAAHRNMALVEATAKLCMTKTANKLCKTVVFNIFGPSDQYFDGLLYTVLNHIPAGASAKQFIHYFQIASTGKPSFLSFFIILNLISLAHSF